MANRPLYILFLWHMHQPFYRDPVSGVYRLPWVRLHGIKDYFDMPAILKNHPGVRQTFNMVPSLLEQLEDYAAGQATDFFLELTKKPAGDLDPGERLFVVRNFFLANQDHMIHPYPRYRELLRKRGAGQTMEALAEAARLFTDDEIRDLQIWFNLAWFDPMFRNEDPLRSLIEKGRGFSEDDKRIVIDEQVRIIDGIIPLYRDMASEGRIELSVSPYFHPILPLVWNSDAARVSMPWATLPERFSYPEDVREHLGRAIDYFERCFGHRPRGLWPSEGSVSQDILSAVSEQGLQWIATDEAILSASRNQALRDDRGGLRAPADLFQPYRLAGDVQVIFRDHDLSDRVGFVYSRMEARDAVEDFIGYLNEIRRSLPDDRAYAVPVILDGENAWEWFPDDGHEFLNRLYERLAREPGLEAVTVSEYLDEHPAERSIETIFPGSWINGNFAIWIGHEEDNTAWEHLRKAHEVFDALDPDTVPEEVREEIYRAILIAEGSDWCWWYGDEHTTENAEEFDSLYRENLKQVYRLAGLPVPPELEVPVLRNDRTVVPEMEPRAFLAPSIDGEVTNYFEWLAAGRAVFTFGGGAMREAEETPVTFYYGFDLETLFVRIEPVVPGRVTDKDHDVVVNVISPAQRRITVTVGKDSASAKVTKPADGGWTVVPSDIRCAAATILELAVPFDDLGVRPGESMNIFVSVYEGDNLIGRAPGRGALSITAPTCDFEATMWQ